MTELEDLKKEVAALEAKKKELLMERDLRLKKISLQLQNVPAGFASSHPVIATGLSKLAKGGLIMGKAAYKGLNDLADRERAHELEMARARKGQRKAEA